MSTDLPSFAFDPPPAPEPLQATRSIGSFWRRFFAFFVDSLILGMVGWCLVGLFFDTLSQLGPWGKLLGFLIAVPYFAVMESSVGGGQSLGKRLLHLRVVDAQGNTLTFENSFARYTVFAAPFFLNGLALPVSSPPWIGIVLVGGIVFGVGGATLYLLVFNRNTRQGLHDFAVGSYVVRADDKGPVQTKPMWKFHWAILGLLLLTLAVSLILFVHKTETWGRFPQLIEDARLVGKLDNVQDVHTSEPRLLNGSGDRTKKVLIVDVTCVRKPTNREAFVEQVARIVLQNDPQVQGYDMLSIGITRSYDIGIASGWFNERYAHTPAEWIALYRASPAQSSAPAEQ